MPHITTADRYIHRLIRRNLEQALACSGSLGHGALRDRHCMIPDISITAPDTPKVHILYFDSATNQGAEETRPAKAAPAPNVTKTAGNAQQTKVPSDVNRLKVGYKVFFAP